MTAEVSTYVFKEFVSRQGRGKLKVTDNAKTFKVTTKRITKIKNVEDISGLFLKHWHWIKIQFVKSALVEWVFWKTYWNHGNSATEASYAQNINYNELEDTLLEVKCFMNKKNIC